MKFLAFCFIIALVGAGVYEYTHTTPPAHIVISPDNSESVEPGCNGLIQATQTLIGQAGFQKGSTVTLLAMGRSALAPEPRLVFSQEIPTESEEVYGSNPDAYKKAMETFLKSLHRSCGEAQAIPASDSPILRLMERSIAHLRTLCAPKGGCYAVIKSDAIETVDVRLARVISRAAVDGSVTLPPELVGALDNTGISNLKICGVSQIKARKPGTPAPPSPETLGRIWKSLFTHPELVSIEPFCGRSEGGQP